MPDIPPKVLQDVLRNLEETQRNAVKAIEGAVESARQNIEKLTISVDDHLTTSQAKQQLKSGIPATFKDPLAPVPAKAAGGYNPAKHTPDWLSVELRKLNVSGDKKPLSYNQVPFSVMDAKSPYRKAECKVEIVQDPGSPLMRVKLLAGPGVTEPVVLTPEQTYAFLRWVTGGDRMVKTMAGIGFGTIGTALATTLIYNLKEDSE